MPERYMALNSMGIGFSGLIGLLINGILLLCFSDENEFARVITFYVIGFLILTGIACMHFMERRS